MHPSPTFFFYCIRQALHLVLPTSLKAYTGHYLLAADQEAPAAGVPPAQPLPLLSCSFCKGKASRKENLQSHFNFLLKTYWCLPTHVTPDSDSFPRSVVTPFLLIPNSHSQLDTTFGFAPARVLIRCSGYKIYKVRAGLCFLKCVTTLETLHYKMKG